MLLIEIFDVDFTEDVKKSLLALKLTHPSLIFKVLLYSGSMVYEIFVDFDVFGILHLHRVKTVDEVEFSISLLAYIMCCF